MLFYDSTHDYCRLKRQIEGNFHSLEMKYSQYINLRLYVNMRRKRLISGRYVTLLQAHTIL